MANRHMKNVPHHLIIRKMQIKTTRDTISHLSEWLSSINQQTSAGEDVENRELLHCLWECRLVQPLWKAEWRYLKNF